MSSSGTSGSSDWSPSIAAVAWALEVLADRIAPWCPARQIRLTYRRPAGGTETVTVEGSGDVSGEVRGAGPGGAASYVIHGSSAAWPLKPPPPSSLAWLSPLDPEGQRVLRWDLPLLFGHVDSPGHLEPRDLPPDGQILPPDGQTSPRAPQASSSHAPRPSLTGWLYRDDGAVHCRADLVLAVIWALLRVEEEDVPWHRLDSHGRFPASASYAYQGAFLDIPVIDAFGRVLAAWADRAGTAAAHDDDLAARAPNSSTASASDEGPTPHPHRLGAPPVRLSCDVDRLRPFASLPNAARAVAGQLIRGRWGRAVSLAREWRRGRSDLAATAEYTAVLDTAELARALELPFTAYFFAQPGPVDGDYSLSEPAVRGLLGRLAASDVEIGLHASYASGSEPERLIQEAAALRETLDVTPSTGPDALGSRQHFLRIQPLATWRAAETAGLVHEASLGYPDHEGFRAGTCRPYRPFDLERDVPLEVRVRPLVAMDVTLRNYRRLSPVAAAQRMADLAVACREVGGTFSFLWHNTSHTGPWAPYAAAFRDSLTHIAALRQAAPYPSNSTADVGAARSPASTGSPAGRGDRPTSSQTQSTAVEDGTG